jgi:hypothetical protein
MMAGHGDEQDGDDKDGAQKHSGFCGEMKQRSTR